MALNGFFDSLVPIGAGEDDTIRCINKANELTSPIDERRYALGRDWHPTNYFEPESIRRGVASVQAVLSQAFDVLAKAQTDCAVAPGCSFPTGMDRYRALLRVTNQSKNYLDAADSAETSAAAAFKTAYVFADGFKEWAMDALGAASDAIGDSYVVSCIRPWWSQMALIVINLVSDAYEILRNIAGVAEDVVNATYQAGKAVVTIAKKSFDLLGWVSTHAPLLIGGAILFFGGRYAWRHREAIKDRFPALRAIKPLSRKSE
jgi:hypothetical protein